MTARFFFFADRTLPPEALSGCDEFCRSLADYTGQAVEAVAVGEGHLEDLRTLISMWHDIYFREVFEPRPAVSAAPMSSAPFVWREDGRPDWAEMWTNFCDLALYGGPPHRGEESALHAPDPERAATATPDEQPWEGYDPIAEIRRGIWETTGLFAEPAEEPGWVVVTCDSKKMAAWLCACIILENVDARCEEERLFLPASRDFHLKDEVKSVITVLAKTHHYWQAHIEAQQQSAGSVARAS
jgi:sirohydrochlorin cobaltochelatase